MAPDTDLLRRYVDERSEEAFAELVRRHLNLVYGAALRQVGGDAHAARDIAQSVFTDLARKARVLGGRDVLASWLYTSTRFAAAKVRRAAARRAKHEREAELMHALERDTADREWEKLQPLIDDLVHELDERDRAVVVLRYFENRPFAEIGAVVGVSEDAARMRTERALEKLRVRLGRRGIASTSAALGAALAGQSALAAPPALAGVITSAALAGSATAGGVTAGWTTLLFMSTGKIVGTIVAVGALSGIGLGLYGLNAAREAEAAFARADQERAALNSRLRETEARAARAETERRASEARLAALQKPAEPARGGANPGAASKPYAAAADNVKEVAAKGVVLQAVADKMAVMADPEVQRARLQMERLGLGLRFAALYRTLNLSPEQIARFEARVLEQTQGAMDIFAVAQSRGLAPDDPAIVALNTQARSALDNDLRAQLGENGFAEYERFVRTYAAREVVSGMLGNLASAGAPLSLEQINQLTQVVAANGPTGEKNARPNDVNWNGVLAQAQPFLSVPQLDALQRVAAHAAASRQVQLATEPIIRARASGPGAAPRPPGS